MSAEIFLCCFVEKNVFFVEEAAVVSFCLLDAVVLPETGDVDAVSVCPGPVGFEEAVA